MKILLIKPYQPVVSIVVSPPLGLLYLAAALRQRLGSQVKVDVLDMKARGLDTRWLISNLHRYSPDLIGVSALNFEQNVSFELAQAIKAINPRITTAIGGPLAHNRSAEILSKSAFDWAFEGEADHSFSEAVARLISGQPLGQDIPGFAYKIEQELYLSTCTATNNLIIDLDQIPLPAWDLVDFELYKKLPNMNSTLKGQRYAPIFTSRGCPYKCNYCHDIFGKKFRHRSAENVLAEIELLHEKYGVDEFQVVDDIFNLHKPRLNTIMHEVQRRWPKKLHFCFPNGLRSDILDTSVLDALRAGGTYSISVAIETVTPRLQQLVEKHLDIAKAAQMLDEAEDRGIMVRGFFMLGFPTETIAEMQATIKMALASRLTLAHFFGVIPQPKTPLYQLAQQENAIVTQTWQAKNSYRSTVHWYEAAYGYPLSRLIRKAHMHFYLHPKRIYRMLRRLPLIHLLRGLKNFLSIIMNKPMSLQPIPPESFGSSSTIQYQPLDLTHTTSAQEKIAA